MKTKLIMLATSGIAGVLAVRLTGTEGWTAFGLSFATGIVTAATFDVVRRCLTWLTRQEDDIDHLLTATCPRCERQMTLEVTSDDESVSDDGFRIKTTELQCSRCGAELRIGSGEGGPVVTRLNF